MDLLSCNMVLSWLSSVSCFLLLLSKQHTSAFPVSSSRATACISDLDCSHEEICHIYYGQNGRCIPRGHHGQCPSPWLSGCSNSDRSDQCMSDGHCENPRKCCESGCGRRCVNGVVISGTATVSNRYTKNGRCPMVSRMNCSTVYECIDDRGCPGNRKCCSNGCGTECVAPTTIAKYGNCPRVYYDENCSSLEPDECSDDSDCHGYHICCKEDCRNTCLDPWKMAKPGQCTTLEGSTQGLRNCTSDRHCSDDMKCCWNSTTLSGWCLRPKLLPTDVIPQEPSSYCYQNRQRYRHGDRWSPDLFSVCRCWAGVIKCLAVRCKPPPSGCRAVPVDGQCCPDIQCLPAVEKQGCTSDNGVNHCHNDVWTTGACRQCMCQDGSEICTSLVCESNVPTNTSRCKSLPQPGTCCPRVVCSERKDATVCTDGSGVVQFNGNKWHEDSCTACICDNGRVKCHDRSHNCPTLPDSSCYFAIIEAQCCPDIVCPRVEAFDLGCNTTDPFCPSQCDRCTCGANRVQCHLPVGDCSFNQSLCYAVDQGDSLSRCPDVICNKGEESLCYHGDVPRYSGEAWSEDSCTSCLCDEGIALCRVTTCPPLRPGCEAVYTEGKCCPEITCEDSSDGIACFIGGEEMSEGSSWYRDPCTLCVCQEGVVHCSQIHCPDLQPMAGCKLMSIPGQCCPIRACRGGDEPCLHDDITIQLETRQNLLLPAQAPLSHLNYRSKYWLESASCSCLSGGLFCSRPACPVARERCTEEGTESSHTCPRDSCPSEKPGRCPKYPPKESDHCVKHCDQDSDCEGALKCCGDGCTMKCAEPDFSNAVPSSSCVDNYGYQRAEGDVWYRDVCTQCACMGAQVVCKERECPRPPPDCQQMAPYDDECCAPIVCPQTTERSCSQHTYSISSGSIWYPDTCQTCHCDSGHENCTFYQCLATPQEGCVYRLVHNRCCPEKFCLPVDSCRLEDEVHLNGEQWYQSPCEVCVCLKGRVSCRTLNCPSATHNRTECSETGQRDGGGDIGNGGQSACCVDLSCQRDESLDTMGFCLHDDIERVVGDVWFTDPCTSCSCLPSGAVTCITMSCPPLVVGQGCRAVPVQGQCCPQIVCHGVHSCMSNGIEHLNGEVWQEDGCTTCLCHNTQVTCTHRICPVPKPNCRYSSKPPPLGQCCREVVCMPVAAPSCRDSPISDKFYLSNEVWIRDICTIAQCDNGAVITKRDRCPDVSPPHGCFLVAIQGECCPHIDCSQGKPGQCPLQSTHHVQSSGLDACLHDADCPGSKKCCHDGTSFSCSNPLTIDHQGQCPPILLSKLPLVQACTMSCYSDQDCSPVEKCCMSKGCGMACVRPIILHNARPASNFSSQIGALLQNLVGSYSTEKSGQCPTYSAREYSQRPLVAQCIFDYDCPGNEKCCAVAGFKICLLPHLEERRGHCPLMRFTGTRCPTRQTECLVDQDCPLARKCCFDGCSNQCLPIARANEDAPCKDISETCGRACPHGYATNTLQCEICRCSRRCHTQLNKCPIDCPHGYATDRVGCKMCHCKRAVKPMRGIREFLDHSICLPLDRSTCPLNCSRGFATDSLGCVVCRCKPEGRECTPIETCGLYCPLGYATNHKGCDVCRCRQRDGTEGLNCPVSHCPGHCSQESMADHSDCTACACQPQRNDCPVMTRDTCQLRCQRGFATDRNGCEICKCTRPDDECNTLVSSRTCQKVCLHGLATDVNGCRICACKVQAVEPRKDFYPFQSMRESPCQPVTSENCALVCPDGYATDQGCEMCACRKLEGCPVMSDQQCPLMASCPYGLATDRGGCTMCDCRQPIACVPVALKGCHQHCPHGRATDSDGCEICACKNTSSMCPVITATNCPKLCTYGYATDPTTDCETCQCKQPTDIPVPVTSFRICRPVSCGNNCTRGYLYDLQGCQTCNCIPEDVVCPDLTIHTCPQMLLCPYGLAKDTRGCPICFCQVESGCYHVSRLTCDLQCLYGFATDDRGCDVCACRIFDNAKCDPTVALTCPHKCPYGLATNQQGCEICMCKNQARELSILTLRPVVACPPVAEHCQLDCQHGLATDEMGCSMCRCKQPITDENCSPVLSHECPLVNRCPYGLATDSRGCEVCRCKHESPCLPLPSCSLRCPRGLATDALGCHICACKNTSSLCPEVTIEACPLSSFCELGLATDVMGCEICKCRVKVLPFVWPREDTYESALPAFQAPYLSVQLSFDATYCPIFSCDVQCPENGFATNAMGCPVCKCAVKDATLCSALSASCKQRHTCPFGLATNDDGCEICACRLPVFCPSLDNNCSLECETGRASDPNGCEICRCKNTSPDQCPEELSGSNCPITCPFGLATDQNGCVVCRCKVPGTITMVDLPRSMGSGEAPDLIPPQWIPTVTCPALHACNLSCDTGFATDVQGCTVCRCISSACSVEIDSNRCPLSDICPYGLASNEDGCLICKCRRPTPCPAVIPIKCIDSCPQGFASDEFGCPQIAACRCLRQAWDPLCNPTVLQKCNRVCSHGYMTDSDGCEICACRMPFSIGAFMSIITPVYRAYWQEIGFPHSPYTAAALVPASLCPLVDDQVCQLVCPNGLATDLAGCPVCRCKTPQENCPTIDPLLCPLIHTCPFGLVTGQNGCEICVCRQEMRCEPVSDLTCSTRCVHGHSTDSFGCPVCQSCARHAGECPPINPWNCMKQCTNGYATDQEGCPVCKCRHTARNFPIATSLQSRLFNQTRQCPDVPCSLRCVNGYQTDDSGCSLCLCIQATHQSCSELHCDMQCPYGFTVGMDGCVQCQCKSAVRCRDVTPFNCHLTCNHGYGTDIHGCEKCMCKKPRSECGEGCQVPLSTMNCAFGLATDSNGCEICMCKMSVASGFLLGFNNKPSDCPALSATACTLVCDGGYLTNHLGCQICQCVNQSGFVDDCPPMGDCPLQSKCPYGLANDRDHCPRCACRHPGICEPLPEYCDLECPWGFATDKYGCELCQCKKTQECPSLESCPLTCPLGLATCPCLCDICKCKLPNSDAVSTLAKLTRITMLNGSSSALAEESVQHRCPDQLCLKQCHHGYKRDPLTGCPTCLCSDRMRCPSLREPKIITEKRCDSAEDCEPPYMCCYTGSRFMCVKALGETCLDKSGSQHSHGEVWYENCRTQGSCFHGNIMHIVFMPPQIPDGCEVQEVVGHCFPSYTCDDDSCQSKSSWSVDECTTCSCVEGKPVCTTLPCPEIPNGCRALAIEGACCPDIICPGCSDAGGHPTVEGQMWNNDLCTSCVCHQGETACRRVACESPGRDCLQVFLPNQCCPIIVCPTANKRPCEAVRSALAPLLLMDDRQTWLPSYYTPTCDSHGFFNATQCYPAEGVCWCANHLGREQEGTRMKNGVPSCTYSGCIDREGNYRGENEHWHEDPCTNCNCTLGLPLCLGLKCSTPPPGCDPLESDTECSCPSYICRDFCFGEQAGFRRLGTVWEGEGCTECKCSSEGTISCRPMTCATPRPVPPGCQRLKRSSSECCPSVTVCQDPLWACPDSLPVALCGSNPCLTAFCPAHPDAICHVNFCGRCQAIFYDGDIAIADCSPRPDQAIWNLLVTDVASTSSHISCNPNQKLPTASWSEYYPRCTGYGTFSPKQCDATGTCWCVDRDGLPENNPKTSTSSRITCVEAPCRKELNENARKDNRGDPVTTNPVCNGDGTYAEEQCDIDGSRCWCSERDGTMVQGTEQPRGENLTCQPACVGIQPLVVISCNSVSPCPLNYFCRFQSLSNLGICCPQG